MQVDPNSFSFQLHLTSMCIKSEVIHKVFHRLLLERMYSERNRYDDIVWMQKRRHDGEEGDDGHKHKSKKVGCEVPCIVSL